MPVEIETGQRSQTVRTRPIGKFGHSIGRTGLERKLECLTVDDLVAEPAGKRVPCGEALNPVTLILRETVGEDIVIELPARFVCGKVLFAVGRPVLAAVICA